MPFDPATFVIPDEVATVEQFRAADPKTRLKMLSTALRLHEDNDFLFDYNIWFTLQDDFAQEHKDVAYHGCGTIGCAGGLALHHWGDTVIKEKVSAGHIPMHAWICPIFGLSAEKFNELFTFSYLYPKHAQITPAMVADNIDDYLKTLG